VRLDKKKKGVRKRIVPRTRRKKGKEGKDHIQVVWEKKGSSISEKQFGQREVSHKYDLFEKHQAEKKKKKEKGKRSSPLGRSR